MFANDRYVKITVAYEGGVGQPGLGWVAPELKGARLRLVDERAGQRPSRTWAGVVDRSTYERFADAWRLPDEPSDAGRPRPYCQTLDGLNWQTDGESPIVYVRLCVLTPTPNEPRMAGGGTRSR